MQVTPSLKSLLIVASATLLVSTTSQARDGHGARFFAGGRAVASSRDNDRADRDGERRIGRLFDLSRDSAGGPKRVEIDISTQRLRAWEGERLVMQSRISSGRGGSTPTGRYSAGFKHRHHYSSLYNDAYMPWSVQVAGDVFVHGFSSVPRYPASHGCIRLPVTGTNPARRFYEWVDSGTPIRIVN